MKKRIISIIATIAALAAGFVPSASAATFTDVPSNHWAATSISTIADKGAFAGYTDGTFRPSNEMTHEEFVKVIVSLIASDTIGADAPVNDAWTAEFADWAQPYIARAQSLGLICDGSDESKKMVATITDCYSEAIDGIIRDEYLEKLIENDMRLQWDLSDRNITPGTVITRQEAARIVGRAMYLIDDGLMSVNTRFCQTRYNNASSGMAYTCSGGASSNEFYRLFRLGRYPGWVADRKYEPDIIVSYMNGLIGTDDNNNYNPKQGLTRAEASVIINRLVDKSQRFASNTEEYVARNAIYNVELALEQAWKAAQ